MKSRRYSNKRRVRLRALPRMGVILVSLPPWTLSRKPPQLLFLRHGYNVVTMNQRLKGKKLVPMKPRKTRNNGITPIKIGTQACRVKSSMSHRRIIVIRVPFNKRNGRWNNLNGPQRRRIELDTVKAETDEGLGPRPGAAIVTNKVEEESVKGGISHRSGDTAYNSCEAECSKVTGSTITNYEEPNCSYNVKASPCVYGEFFEIHDTVCCNNTETTDVIRLAASCS